MANRITRITPDATTSTKGKVQLATDAETVAKTDTTKAITPSNLVAANIISIQRSWLL